MFFVFFPFQFFFPLPLSLPTGNQLLGQHPQQPLHKLQLALHGQDPGRGQVDEGGVADDPRLLPSLLPLPSLPPLSSLSPLLSLLPPRPAERQPTPAEGESGGERAQKERGREQRTLFFFSFSFFSPPASLLLLLLQAQRECQ